MATDTALITGASAGIGRALAAEFADHGHDVVLVARREEKLLALADELNRRAGIDARVVVQDLAERDGPDVLFETVRERGITVDVLVNNVGIGTQGPFVETDLETELDELQLNVATPTHLAKLFGREMVARGDGKILNVASSAAFQPGPYMAVYYASKAYLLSFSEAIAEELRPDVTVTALCPGPVRTEFQERAGMSDTPLGSGAMQDVETVASAGYRGLMDGEVVVIPGLRYWVLSKLVRITPRPLVRKITKRMNAGR